MISLNVSGVNVYAANPGLSHTNIGRHVRETSGIMMAMIQSIFYWPLLRSPNNAAQVPAVAVFGVDTQVTAPVRITELSYLFHLVKKSIKV